MQYKPSQAPSSYHRNTYAKPTPTPSMRRAADSPLEPEAPEMPPLCYLVWVPSYDPTAISGRTNQLWNAGGLQSKHPELLKYLTHHGVDIALLQETHLKPTKTVRFPGYNVVRKDRDTGRAAGGETKGGGVLTLIREGLDRKEHVNIVNAYVPPIRQGEADGRQQNFDPRHWPSSLNTLICGDINGHSPQWDASCDEEDAVGRLVADWMLDWSFMPANTGEATRYAHDGHGTAPDVTLHRTADMRKVQWRIGEDLGSDHMPIIIDYRVAKGTPLTQRRTFWNTRKADWNAYRRPH
ncbi:Tbingi protein [Aphelenchoides avenae]|nr:Tbingi protein [Aphelenchus avenae]